MGDFGIKVSTSGNNVNTSELDETSFDSRYSSLMLLEKKTLSFTALAGQTGQSDTETYSHGLGYAPFVLGFVEYTLYGDGVSDILPHVYDNATPYGSSLYIDISLTMTTSEVQVGWSVEQSVSGTPEALDNNIEFDITLHIYSFKLGQ